MAVLDLATYNNRLSTCKACPYWENLKCARGHAIRSLLGCPLRKFGPIGRNGYAKDIPPPPKPPKVTSMQGASPQRKAGGCSNCATPKPSNEPPPIRQLTAASVTAEFVSSMLKWAKSGLRTVDSIVHEKRQAVCRACPHYENFQCKKCGCVVSLKTKLATEHCPDSPPRW